MSPFSDSFKDFFDILWLAYEILSSLLKFFSMLYKEFLARSWFYFIFHFSFFSFFFFALCSAMQCDFPKILSSLLRLFRCFRLLPDASTGLEILMLSSCFQSAEYLSGILVSMIQNCVQDSLAGCYNADGCVTALATVVSSTTVGFL